MKVKLFTHIDLDGVGCAIVANTTFNKQCVDVEYCNYDDFDGRFQKFLTSDNDYDLVFITDISPREDKTVELIKESSLKIKMLDHHPTVTYLNTYSWADVFPEITDPTGTTVRTCGTSLLYSYLINNGYIQRDETITDLVEKIRRYDTWEWTTKYNDEQARDLSSLLHLVGIEEFVERFSTNLDYRLTDSEAFLVKMERARTDSYIKSKLKHVVIRATDKFPGKLYRIAMIFAEQYASELGNAIALANPEVDFVMVINPHGSVSYRTVKEDVHVGKIAESLGGGGHAKAAGSAMPADLLPTLFCDILDGITSC